MFFFRLRREFPFERFFPILISLPWFLAWHHATTINCHISIKLVNIITVVLYFVPRTVWVHSSTRSITHFKQANANADVSSRTPLFRRPVEKRAAFWQSFPDCLRILGWIIERPMPSGKDLLWTINLPMDGKNASWKFLHNWLRRNRLRIIVVEAFHV